MNIKKKTSLIAWSRMLKGFRNPKYMLDCSDLIKHFKVFNSQELIKRRDLLSNLSFELKRLLVKNIFL